MKKKVYKIASTFAVALMLLTGCGGPKYDVTVFILPATGLPFELADKLEAGVKAKLGETPTLDIVSSPMYSVEKLIVEVAAGDHGVIIVPDQQFRSLGAQGGYVNLDKLAEEPGFPMTKDDLKKGIMEIDDNGKKETHLFAIPLEQSKLLKDAGISGKDLYAFIPVKAKNQENSMKVLRALAVK